MSAIISADKSKRFKREERCNREGVRMVITAEGRFFIDLGRAKNMYDVHILLKAMAEALTPEPEEASRFVTAWISYLMREVRNNSALTYGHRQQHYPGIEWDGCEICVHALWGPHETEAIHEAVEEMFWAKR